MAEEARAKQHKQRSIAGDGHSHFQQRHGLRRMALRGPGPARDGRAAPRPWRSLSISVGSVSGARPPPDAAASLAWAHGGNDDTFFVKANMLGGGVLALDILLDGDSSVGASSSGIA